MDKIDIKKLPIPLPAGIIETDLERPAWDSKKKSDVLVQGYEQQRFELWAACIGSSIKPDWFIPTLLIAAPGRRQRMAGISTERVYAARISDGKGGYRIGGGPHVKARITVYVRVSRLKDLQRFIDIRSKGQADAGQIRDRISSRRAQGSLERAAGHRSWRWDV